MTFVFKQNKKDKSYLKLVDALLIMATCTTRANFVSDEVREHNVCPQEICETWR